MATYGDAPAEYPYMPQKRKKQKYTLVTLVVDFTNNLPITSGAWNRSGNATTAWAVADVLQLIHIRAGQTVMGVQLEILTRSKDALDKIQIGYGTDAARWGQFNLSKTEEVKDFPFSDGAMQDDNQGPPMGEPVYFSSSDTIDITIDRAALQGKIRLIVHLLEDDR